MSNSYVVVIEGLEELRDIEKLDARVLTRARQAINNTLRRARTSLDREVRQQIAFPARYLGSRLRVTQYAQGASLQGTITGRDRPTSLARFATSKQSRRNGVRVQVSPGSNKRMKRAFLMPLAGGNLGLAMRLKEGESIRNKKFLKKAGKGLYLLYGPSVNQVFAGVADDETEQIAAQLQREFNRLMELDR